MQNKKSKSEIFLGIALILLGILGTTAKIYTHIGEWKVGQIVKLVIIAGITIYGAYTLIRKKSEK